MKGGGADKCNVERETGVHVKRKKREEEDGEGNGLKLFNFISHRQICSNLSYCSILHCIKSYSY